MQIITIAVSALADNPLEATGLGIAAVVTVPPVMKRLAGLVREFWGPKVTRLRRVIADRVAPTEPGQGQDEEVAHLSERV
ncbi:hypothetical protein ACFXEL_11070 [Streptomyces sp. NPDC059382]|uniref:hypothetical protein n=1 Tax=Streptomyces TaxID=1883 RepID=UPI0033235382